MSLALKQAERALEEEEIPVGAVVVCQGKIVAKAYNQTEMLTDVTAHAEMLAITSAAQTIGAKRLYALCDFRALFNVCWSYLLVSVRPTGFRCV